MRATKLMAVIFLALAGIFLSSLISEAATSGVLVMSSGNNYDLDTNGVNDISQSVGSTSVTDTRTVSGLNGAQINIRPDPTRSCYYNFIYNNWGNNVSFTKATWSVAYDYTMSNYCFKSDGGKYYLISGSAVSGTRDFSLSWTQQCADYDGDGYGASGTDLSACSGSTTLADCADNDANKNPTKGYYLQNGACATTCGDNIVAGSEACDPGSSDSSSCDGPSAGTNACTARSCGDGYANAAGGESCDDANTNSGDGCSATCQVESGYNCAGSPSVCDNSPPTVTATSSPANPVQGQSVKITVSGTDGQSSVTQTQIYVDSVLKKTCSLSSCYYTSTYSAGQHTFYGTATSVGGLAQSSTITLTVAQPQPTVVRSGQGFLGLGSEFDLDAVDQQSAQAPATGASDMRLGLKSSTQSRVEHKTNARFAITGVNANSDCTVPSYAQDESPAMINKGTTWPADYYFCVRTNPSMNVFRYYLIDYHATDSPPDLFAWQEHQQAPVCGDGIVQVGEQCDDGNTVDTDACVGCKNAYCGDGFLEQKVEQCDDGNTVSGDGCSSTCKLEYCGNGIVDGSEQCDDGNTINTDSCTNACKLAVCGDGYVQTGAGEQCDGTNLQGKTCYDVGPSTPIGTLKCSPTCKYDTSECVSNQCTPGATSPCTISTLQGECAKGTRTCQQFVGWGQCTQVNQPATETCDGLDNDCNGQVDDGSNLCSLVNAASACVSGSCQITSCSANYQDCDKSAASGCESNTQTDINNCGSCGNACADKAGATKSCVSGACVYSCHAGHVDLNGDGTGSDTDGCEYACTPSNGGVEICDGRDNDCNGAIDEGFDQDGDTYTTCGTSTVDGSYVGVDCDDNPADDATQYAGNIYNLNPNGTSIAAHINPGAVENVFDGVDNNCNGRIDEGAVCGDGHVTAIVGETCDEGSAFTNSFSDSATCNGPGAGAVACKAPVCGDGYVNAAAGEQCDDGNTVSGDGCSSTCQTEACSGTETRACNTELQGVCSASTQTCASGNWGGCIQTTPASSETCDNQDNNCDGAVDEGLTQNCPLTLGVCAGKTQTCSAGQWSACNYGTNYQATETSCDNQDNNCDGIVDEGCACTTDTTRACGTDVGECIAGTQTCTNGQWSADCTGAVGPQIETCNGKDDNCDGNIDEGGVCDTITNCGTFGNICPVDPHGVTTCTSGSCGITCSEGYELSSGVCVASAPSCGYSPTCTETTRTICSDSTHTQAQTRTTACGGDCTDWVNSGDAVACAGSKICSGGVCVTPPQCSVATDCQAPSDTNAHATCTNNVCGSSCNDNYELCGNACFKTRTGDSCDENGNWNCQDGYARVNGAVECALKASTCITTAGQETKETSCSDGLDNDCDGSTDADDNGCRPATADCGNGVINAGEECDGTDFGGKTCATELANGRGDLVCTPGCEMSEQNCKQTSESSAEAWAENKEVSGTVEKNLFTSYKLTPKRGVNRPKIMFDVLFGKPADIPAPQGNVFKYAQVTTTNFNDADISGATLTFSIAKSWLAENKLDKNKVKLNRYETDKWVPYDATLVSEDDAANAVYYSTSPPGLSTFAVIVGGLPAENAPSGGAQVPQQATQYTVPVSAEQPQPAAQQYEFRRGGIRRPILQQTIAPPAPAPTRAAAPAKEYPSVTVQGAPRFQLPKQSTFVLLAVILALLGFASYKFYFKPKFDLPAIAEAHDAHEPGPIENAKSFIAHALAEGHSIFDIKNQLLSAGWGRDDVEQAVNESAGDLEDLQSTAEQFGVDDSASATKQLRAYVKAGVAKGYTEAQIKAIVLANGWPADVVDKAMQ